MKKFFFPVLISFILCASISAQTKNIINLNTVNLAGVKMPARELNFENMDYYDKQDSLASENKPLKPYSPSAVTIIGEVFIGPLAGLATAIPVYFLLSGNLENGGGGPLHHDYNYGVAGVIGAAYAVGTAIGVNLFARADNPEVTFGGTLLGSLAGAGAGIGAAALINKGAVIQEQHSAGNYVLLFAPLIGSMVYANFIAPHPASGSYSSNIERCRSLVSSFSHKDLYNSTLQYKMDLFTIAF